MSEHGGLETKHFSAPGQTTGGTPAKPSSVTEVNSVPTKADDPRSLGPTGNSTPAKAVFENKKTAFVSRLRTS